MRATMQKRALLLVFSLAALVDLAGCEPCEYVCGAEADAYALCLGEWGMTWSDVGPAGTEFYEEDCKDTAKLERTRRTDEEKLDANQVCTERTRMLNSTTDCDELYDLLEDYDPTEE